MEKERIGEASVIISRLLRQQWSVAASWGKHNEQIIPLPSEEEQEKTVDRGGLEFEVNGYKFKGTVRVVYELIPDLFRVEFVKDGKIEKVVRGVYNENLIEVIDDYVEYTGEDYEDRVKGSYPNLMGVMFDKKEK